MRGRPKKVAAKDAQTHQETRGAKDAQKAAEEVVGHQGPETADEAAQEADVPQDDPNRDETASEAAETLPGGGMDATPESQEAVQSVDETPAPKPQNETEGGQTAPQQDQTPPPTAVDTEHALALKRWRENPTCACGCGKTLPNPKKHFIIGHDGKAKAILRRVMRGELPADAVPTELILRHREIRFIMAGPEYRRLVEGWQKTK